MPKKKKPLFKITDGDGNALIPPGHKIYGEHLERLAEADRGKIRQAKNAARVELNAQRINSPPGEFLSGYQLQELRALAFVLDDFDCSPWQPPSPPPKEIERAWIL